MRTKQCKRAYIALTVLHFLALFGPFLYYLPYGYATGTPKQTVGMSMMVLVALILLIVSVVVDVSKRAGLHKTMMWVLIAGVFIVLKNITVFMWIMMVTSILDEIVFVPLKNRYKSLWQTNKEIDKRS